jgi:hypothetical protein
VRSLIRTSLLGLATVSLLSACAGTTYTTAASGGEDDAEGIRYYDSAPFLLVYSDGKGGLKTELIYLPDTTQTRVVRPYAWFSKNDAKYIFDNGVLTTALSEVDETVVPKAIVSAAKQVVAAQYSSADAGGAVSATQKIPPPALFRIFVDPNGNVRLRGSYGQDANGQYQDINITVLPKDQEEKAK